MTGRLHIDSSGRLQGPANITHNSPWPCVNGEWGFQEPPRGIVMHTEAGFGSSPRSTDTAGVGSGAGVWRPVEASRT